MHQEDAPLDAARYQSYNAEEFSPFKHLELLSTPFKRAKSTADGGLKSPSKRTLLALVMNRRSWAAQSLLKCGAASGIREDAQPGGVCYPAHRLRSQRIEGIHRESRAY